MYCEKCGGQIGDDAVFCPYCGNKITPMHNKSGFSADYQIHYNTPGHSISSGSIIRMLAVFALAIAVGVMSVLVFIKYKNPGDAPKDRNQGNETKEYSGPGQNTDTGLNSISLYGEVIDKLEAEYGPLDIYAYELSNRPDYESGCVEADGLCYLELIDFNDDGVRELLAVAKHREDEEYTVFIYTIEDGSVNNLITSDVLLDNYLDNYRNLYIETNYAGKSFIDGGFGFDGWSYFKIYGMRDKEFGLISASSITEYYDEDIGSYKKQYYILDTPPQNIELDSLRNWEVSKKQYQDTIDEWIWKYRYDYRIIPLKRTVSRDNLASGYYDDVDLSELETGINNVKEQVASGADEAESGQQSVDSGNPYSQYKVFVDGLISEYGELRVTDPTWTMNENIREPAELNGLCCLVLLDMDRSGSKELLAVYKDEHSMTYQGMVYSILDGKAQRVVPVYQMETSNDDVYHTFNLRRNGDRDLIVVYDGDYEDRGSYTTRVYGFIDGKIGEKFFTRRSGYPYDPDTYYIDDDPVTEKEFSDEITRLLGNGPDVQVMEYGVRGEKEMLHTDLLKQTISDTMDVINGKSTDSDIFAD